VGESLPPGTYRIPIEVRYDYTNWVEYSSVDAPVYGDTSRTVIEEVTIEVERRAQFELAPASDQRLTAGDTTDYRFTLTNTGNQTARDLQLALSARNSSVFFGGLDQPSPTTSVFVPRLAAGEARNFSVTVGAGGDVAPGEYVLNGRVSYTDPSGLTQRSDPVEAPVTVGPEQSFALENVTDDLRVGESGDVRGELVNTGNATVDGVALLARSENPNLVFRETEYAVGTLEPGESAPVSFRVDVSSEADPGPRLVPFAVQYRNGEGDRRTTSPLDARVRVGEQTDEFSVEPVNATVEAGSSGVVRMRVTNEANQTLTDVDAKLFTSDPLSSDDDEAFVSRLEPGESAVLKFQLSVAGSAIAKVYPVSVDFSYTDERGDTVLSDTYRVPVRVTTSSGGGFSLGGLADLGGFGPLPLVAGLLVVALLVLAWWQRDAIRSRVG